MIKQLHRIPSKWLQSRILPWLYSETPGKFWAVWPESDGKPMYVTYREGWEPTEHRRRFAFDVCKQVNRETSAGGVWMAGYIDKDREQEFYLLWRDKDGDIHIPIEFPQTWKELSQWKPEDFEFHCYSALEIWQDHQRAMDFKQTQLSSLTH